MGREYEPTVGQWYDDLENDETFQVLKVDEDQETIHIQHLDGDTEELDVGRRGSRGVLDAFQPAMPVRCFALLYRDQFGTQRLGDGSHVTAAHLMFRIRIDQRADACKHRGGA